MRWDWVAYGVIAVVLIYIVVVFNRLIRQRNVVREAWSGIDVQLKRRTDLVPALVETVKGYATHERSLLEEVTAKRAMSLDAQAQGNVAQNAQATQQLGSAVGRLIAVAEAYPQLKANENFLKLQEQLSEIEEQLQYARRYYNGAVRNLNISIQSFPDLLIAKPLGFSEQPFFELEDSQRANPNISFQQGA
ncbi:MAG: LemA family protein [Xanthobacteraceae bacterium]|nr:LemA family protein [Xanthobacteraceae bacterium]MBX3522250.1 LemA family protein [Xanthobacteraceae bacterium]MBX3535721.1 LemA family protein [Xanthobacteraceae bacterium]MBX3549133.1 LemA family protein [Xanthobacteraceae bacterium]MCW5675300.1 LemA family protein [Xanthobacteraceae bacterium]